MSVQHPRPLMRALVATAATAALVVPGTTYAQTLRHRDPAHDVQQAGASSSVQDAPANRTTDIVHVTIAHQQKKVVAVIRLRDYAPGKWVWVERIQTASANYTVQGDHSSTGTSFTVTRGKAGTVVPCAVHQLTDKARDTIQVDVPTTCVQDPAWVKVGVGYVRLNGTGGAYADDALRTRGISEHDLTLSKRLAH